MFASKDLTPLGIYKDPKTDKLYEFVSYHEESMQCHVIDLDTNYYEWFELSDFLTFEEQD